MLKHGLNSPWRGSSTLLFLPRLTLISLCWWKVRQWRHTSQQLMVNFFLPSSQWNLTELASFHLFLFLTELLFGLLNLILSLSALTRTRWATFISAFPNWLSCRFQTVSMSVASPFLLKSVPLACVCVSPDNHVQLAEISSKMSKCDDWISLTKFLLSQGKI